ncbi:MAG: ATP-binding protein [Fimbriimonas sp.]
MPPGEGSPARGPIERRLSLLYEAGRRLTRSLDPILLFASMTELVQEVMPCDGLLVSSYTPVDDLIRCEYAWVGGDIHDHTTFPPLPLNREGTGMQSQVILDRKPRLFDVVEKVRERPEGHYTEMAPDGSLEPVVERDPVTKSALMCPMLLDGEVTGVVQVMSDSGRAYTQEDLELLEALVHQLSPAVENSRLYSRLRSELLTREAAERALEESERRFKTWLDSMPLIAWASDAKTGESEYLNRHYYDYTGLDRSIEGTRGWELVVHPEDREAGMKRISKAFADGTPWEQEIRLKRADGVYRWHISRMVALRDEFGELTKWLGSSTDIHEQKEAEAQLERRVQDRTAELESAIRELEGFTYSVSHDLRSPLRSIVATSVMLQQDFAESLPPSATSLLKRQADAAKKMAVLIDDLLRLSRITRQDMNCAPADLSLLAEEIVEEMRQEGTAGSVEFRISPGLNCEADERLIRLALTNLLENAAKFSPQGGLVEFTRHRDAFVVRDQGIGFDMKYIDRLFRPFERLVPDTAFRGTGIGLANVKRIIERHHGKVWAEAAPDKGASFYFTLP